jgi:hypothetical protein
MQGDHETSLEDFTLALGLFGVGGAIPMAARVVHGVVEWMLGDYAAVVADCSALIESGGLSSRELAGTLACRAMARLKVNDSTGARADFNDALATDESSIYALLELLATVVSFVFRMPGLEATVHLVDSLVSALELAPEQIQVELVVNAFALFAEPDTRSFWPEVVRRIHDKLPAKTAEGAAFLLPVADVLEGKDRSMLDALPPEQRAFALDVLERFEPKEENPEGGTP